MNRKSLNIFACAALLLSLVFAGCSTAARNDSNGAVTDDLGRSVVVSGTPQRIVSLAPSATELLFYLGLGTKIVGVDSYSDYPAEAKTIEKVGGFAKTDIEKVVSLRPDLVVAADIHKQQIIPALEKAGLTVVALNPKSVSGVIGNVRLLGKVTGTGAKAEGLADNLEKRVAGVTGRMKELSMSQKPRALVVVWYNPITVAGSGTILDDLIAMAGGQNVAGDVADYHDVNLESVLIKDPQVIMAFSGADASMGGSFEWTVGEPRLATVAARKATPPQIFKAGDEYQRPTVRAVDALEGLARILHPEKY